MAGSISGRVQTQNPSGEGRLFGVPLGDFGIFSSLLISFSVGFICFFASTFLAIFGILFYNSAAHANVNFANSYRLVGLPIGIGGLILGLVFFGSLWIRRRRSGR